MTSYVLVVEDDHDLRDLTVELLGSHGFTAAESADGVRALRTMEALGAPALVLLDLRMPNMNGEELLRRMRAKSDLARVPIIILSGDRNAEKVARRLGAQAGLSKPYSLERLMALVAHLTGKESSQVQEHRG
jgi:CheY-like chemotaxis protein